MTEIKRRFDLTLTINNWIEATEDADYVEEREVGVDFDIIGDYAPATWDDPEENPELEITAIVDLDTGLDITDLLTSEAIDSLMEQVWDAAEGMRQSAKDDYDPCDHYDPYYD